MHWGSKEDFLEAVASIPPGRQDTVWAHSDKAQGLLFAVEKRVSWQPREGVVQGRDSDQGPGHVGRTVVVKKVGKADGVRCQLRLRFRATTFISNLQSFQICF